MTDHDLAGLRKQLLAFGYNILPNKFKVPVLPGWNAPDYLKTCAKYPSAAAIVESWERRFPDAKTTGVRLEGGLGAIDCDVDDPLVDLLLEEIKEIAPEVWAKSPTRYGSSRWKLALFVHITGEPFVRLASHKWDGHQVEIFGGAPIKGKVSRQFGIYGPHSEDADYIWAEGVPALHDIATGDLPALTREQAGQICDAFDRLAEAAGREREVGPDTDTAEQVYDIDEATRFDTDKGGHGISYTELCDEHATFGNMRCSSNFMPGRGASGKTGRCWVFHSERHDCVAVHVYGDEKTHYPAEHAPLPDKMEKLSAQLSALETAPNTQDEPPVPDDAASMSDKVGWLLRTRGYCEDEDMVVRLYEPGMSCMSKPAAFERRHKAWYEVVQTASGRQGKKLHFATDAWGMIGMRIHVAGVRMRPDRPFPLFEEDGKLFKNAYRAPRHAAGGNVAPFSAFLERFLPDPIERNWLLDWMAHKQRRPEIPGSAVIFVADNEDEVREGKFGTGRGLMFRIAHALYGEQYTRPQSFSVLDGTSSQSAYTDWMHGSLLVTVDESRTSPTSHRRGERSATYEVLKDIVDPAPKRRDFKGKYRQAFHAMSYCSFWVATNHGDALAIPERDRRFSVLRNGRVMTPDEALDIVAWLGDATNIGALSRMLAARDLSGFNMLQALETAGKTEMALLARSDVEDLLRDMMEDPERGLVFTKLHVERAIADNLGAQNTFWRGEFRAAWNAFCVRVEGTEGSQRRIRVEGTQRKLFCFRTNRSAVRRMPEAAIRREANKWGGVDGLRDLLKGLPGGEGLKEKDE